MQGHFQQLQGKMEHFQKTHQETMQEKKKQIGDMQKLNMEQKEVISNLEAEVKKPGRCWVYIARLSCGNFKQRIRD